MKNTLTNLYNAITKENPKLLKNKSSFENPGIEINNEIVIFITIGDDNSRSYVLNCKGNTIDDIFALAVKKYINNKPESFVPIHMKIDFITEFLELKDTSFNFNKKITYQNGIEGLAFDNDMNLAFLPQEIVAYDIVQKGKFNSNNISNLLKQHLTFSGEFNSKSIDKLYKFKTKTYYISSNHFYELYRGHRLFKELSKNEILQTINLTKNNYFKNVINKKGKFIYSYYPANDIIERKYNILRHSGTAYSMLETYELTGDEKLLNNVEYAIDFLIKKIETTEINGKKVDVVVERDVVKLGGNALAILLLTKYTQITGNNKYLPLMQSLATWIKEVQSDNGNFSIHKQIYSTGESTDFISNFYIGESVFALVKLFHCDKNEVWLDVAEKAANYLITIKNKGATLETVQHDHWLLYGLNVLYRERKRKLYLEYAFLMAKSIMKTQFTDNKYHEEFVGGYPPQSGKTPKSVPVACRSEGLSNAYYLAIDHDESELAEEIKLAIYQGIKFQLQMQLRPESAMYFEKKDLCLGAFHNKFNVIQLRNDFTQHNISSLIAYYNIISN